MRESTLQDIERIVSNQVVTATEHAENRIVAQLEATLGGIAGQLNGVLDALSDIHDDVHTTPLEPIQAQQGRVEVPIEHVEKPSPRIIPTVVVAADSDPVLIEELLRRMGDEDSAVTPEDRQLGATLVYDHPFNGPQARRISRVKFEDRGPASFITAYDHEREAPRNFRLDRVLDVQVTRPADGLVEL